MSKKPAAALSANLVAVKGGAIPASDMPGRGTPTEVSAAAPPSAASERTSAAEGEGGGMPLNFRVPATFRRDFKVYAAKHGLKLNGLLRLSFEAYRHMHGE